MDNGKLMQLMEQALTKADEIAMAALESEHTYHGKGDKDFALAVDIEVEQAVKLILAGTGIPVLGEELAWSEEEAADRYWVVDPVDGTVNYSRQLPMFGTCIALVENHRPVLGGISFPALSERYLAQKGAGATLNGQPLKISSVGKLCEAMVGVGDFAVGAGAAERNRVRMPLINQLAEQVLRVRILGSAAVQMAWLAAGRIDVSLILSNKPWDVQAGVLIACEAGAVAYDEDGQQHTAHSRYTLVSTPPLKDEVLSVLERCNIPLP